MKKSINTMSAEERGKLFPIILEEHNPDWLLQATQEEMFLRFLLGDDIVHITHIGSTAVPALLAKPTIDFLLEIDERANVNEMLMKLLVNGYEYNVDKERVAPHIMLMKGYTLQGFQGQVFHIHMRYPGDYDEVYFKDYLCSHPAVAQAYGELKKQLQKQFEYDLYGYTMAKSDFIKHVNQVARQAKK